ncbi:hypothetical protein PR048_018789 [Dryococelus australis]|uniref:Uncharacterized protein n=1 Tax=Dryococelus australis TaxID=614101 RepID=A0ABQ9H1S5_9NEOP|nr:hypothetical protein PR048_018789 [Dryococelus australis]
MLMLMQIIRQVEVRTRVNFCLAEKGKKRLNGLGTSNIGHIRKKTIRYTWENKTTLSSAKPDQHRRKSPINKTSAEVCDGIDTFTETLQAVTSHCWRSSSTKVYIPTDFKSLENVYRLYKEDCKTKKFLSQTWRKGYNNGIHIPKKDKCAVCHAKEEGKLMGRGYSLEMFDEHIREKLSTNEPFAKDQKASGTDGFSCIIFGLQKVLNTPHGDNMLLYYSCKYSVYNLTVYKNNRRNVYYYVWGECDGNRGSNEIVSLLYMYISNVDAEKTTINLSLYCDSCPGQNKNHAVLRNYCLRFETIVNNYVHHNKLFASRPLIHAVDSVHSAIETNLKYRVAWAPSEWLTWIENYSYVALSIHSLRDKL